MSIYETINPEETAQIAKSLAKQSKPGQIFILNGEMGAGKTAFAKGFAVGLGISDHITSPTFSILNIYYGIFPFYHFDLYRIEEDVYDQGFEEYFFGNGVCLIEWGIYAIEIIEKGYTVINIIKDNDKGSEYRRIEIENKK